MTSVFLPRLANASEFDPLDSYQIERQGQLTNSELEIQSNYSNRIIYFVPQVDWLHSNWNFPTTNRLFVKVNLKRISYRLINTIGIQYVIQNNSTSIRI